MSRSVKYLYISDRRGNDSMRVEYDKEDGAIEVVKVWEPVSHEWLLVDSDNLPAITQALIEEKIADVLGPNLDLTSAGRIAR